MIKMKFPKDEVVSGKTLLTRYFYSQFCMNRYRIDFIFSMYRLTCFLQI